MLRLLIPILLCVALVLPARAKDLPEAEAAPLRFGMEQAAADKVLSDAAMWRVAYRVETESTCELAAVWSGTVFYKLKFYQGKCCFVEKRAEVGPEEVEQLLQMYRGVYGDSPEATSSQNGALIFSRWVRPEREVTISASGRHGRYKLFYEEFDPVGIADVRVAQERELGEGVETDPLTGRPRIDPLGQAASEEDPETAQESEAAADQPAEDEAPVAEDEPPADEEPKPKNKRRSKQEDPNDW